MFNVCNEDKNEGVVRSLYYGVTRIDVPDIPLPKFLLEYLQPYWKCGEGKSTVKRSLSTWTM